MGAPVIGIIGGSGLYEIDGLADVAWRRVESPFGATSDEFCFGALGGHRVVFVPRHGRGHVLPPSEINFRANIDALKRAGVTDLISLSASTAQTLLIGCGLVALSASDQIGRAHV